MCKKQEKSKFVYPNLTTNHWFTQYRNGCIMFSLVNAKIKGKELGKFFKKIV